MHYFHLALLKMAFRKIDGGKQLCGPTQTLLTACTAILLTWQLFLIHNFIWKCQSSFNPSDGQVYLLVMPLNPFTARQCHQSPPLFDPPAARAVTVSFPSDQKNHMLISDLALV